MARQLSEDDATAADASREVEIVDERKRRPRGRWIALAAGVLLVALAVGAALARSPQRGVFAGGGKAVAFALPDVRSPSDTVAVPERPGRLVVLNFWASWCVPCRKEMPDLERVHRALGDRVVFIGIDHQDARQDAATFLGSTGVTYRSAYDPEGSVAARYHLYGLPTTIVIGAEGRVVGRHTGPVQRTQLLSELREQLDKSR